MKLPMLPLQSIFYPGETVPLHIFEERYKQLIADCRNNAITFGIPVYINNHLEYGTEIQLVEVVNTYDTGEMDITCVARQIFRLKSFETQKEGKLYPAGTIEFIEVDYEADETLKAEVLQAINKLYDEMGVTYTPIPLEKFNSYILVHKIGLSFEQEYELLKITKESDRLLFLKKHLIGTITVLKEVQRTKKTILLNGDFKNFDPLDFKDVTL